MVPARKVAKRLGVPIEWRAFELRPEGEEVPPKPKAYMEAAWQNVRRLAEEVGLEMRPNEHHGPSRLALEGAKYAAAHGKEDAYHEAVFKAHFQENWNISERSTLVDIGTSIGLDGEDLDRALKERRLTPAVLEDEQQAAAWGITAIPCFVHGSRGIMGAQSEEALEAFISEETR